MGNLFSNTKKNTIDEKPPKCICPVCTLPPTKKVEDTKKYDLAHVIYIKNITQGNYHAFGVYNSLIIDNDYNAESMKLVIYYNPGDQENPPIYFVYEKTVDTLPEYPNLDKSISHIPSTGNITYEIVDNIIILKNQLDKYLVYKLIGDNKKFFVKPDKKYINFELYFEDFPNRAILLYDYNMELFTSNSNKTMQILIIIIIIILLFILATTICSFYKSINKNERNLNFI